MGHRVIELDGTQDNRMEHLCKLQFLGTVTRSAGVLLHSLGALSHDHSDFLTCHKNKSRRMHIYVKYFLFDKPRIYTYPTEYKLFTSA